MNIIENIEKRAEKIISTYSPDDTINDYEEKIKEMIKLEFVSFYKELLFIDIKKLEEKQKQYAIRLNRADDDWEHGCWDALQLFIDMKKMELGTFNVIRTESEWEKEFDAKFATHFDGSSIADGYGSLDDYIKLFIKDLIYSQRREFRREILIMRLEDVSVDGLQIGDASAYNNAIDDVLEKLNKVYENNI